MKKIFAPVFLFMIFGNALGGENFTACHFESQERNSVEGKRVRTCFEAGTFDIRSFMSDCRLILDSAKKKFDDMEMETMDSCPSGADAECSNVLGQGLNRFEYGRSDQFLEKRGIHCRSTGGQWERF